MKIAVKYEDEDEDIIIKIFPVDPNAATRLSASVNMEITHGSITHGIHVMLCVVPTLGMAQTLARLIVGIEIQPDGAAWKRGPRGEARPTDAKGVRQNDPS